MGDIGAFAHQVQFAAFAEPFADEQKEIQGKFEAIGQCPAFFLYVRQDNSVEVGNAVQQQTLQHLGWLSQQDAALIVFVKPGAQAWLYEGGVFHMRTGRKIGVFDGHFQIAVIVLIGGQVLGGRLPTGKPQGKQFLGRFRV